MNIFHALAIRTRGLLPAVTLLLVVSLSAFAQWADRNADIPANTGFVNDNAGVIDAQTKQALETRLKTVRDGTPEKIEIAVLTVKTLDGKQIEDYALNVAREWKIGSAEQDNPGVLLVVAIDDRKYYSAVSRDAEGDIPDGLAGSIQRQYLVPAFKAGQFGKGISDTVEAYIRRFGETRGFDPASLQKTEPKAAGPVRQSKGSVSTCGIVGCLVIFAILIFILSSIFGGRRGGGGGGRSSWNGGGFGGSNKRRGDSSASDWLLPVIVGGILGGGGGGSSSGGSSWGDSGGSSGGGSDWGGFGGGGDFGGGGAGGDW
jgi:uncharacterized protein